MHYIKCQREILQEVSCFSSNSAQATSSPCPRSPSSPVLQVLRVQDGGNGACGTCAVVGHCHQKHEGEAKETIFRYLEWFSVTQNVFPALLGQTWWYSVDLQLLVLTVFSPQHHNHSRPNTPASVESRDKDMLWKDIGLSRQKML